MLLPGELSLNGLPSRPHIPTRYRKGRDGADLMNMLAAIGLDGATSIVAADFRSGMLLVRGGASPYLGPISKRMTYSGSSKYRRNSAGVYVSANGVLPEYDADGVNIGVPFEASRTNKLLRSQDFTTSWTLDHLGCSNPIVTPNYALAPDGTMTATRLQMNKTGGTFTRVQQNAAGTGAHVFSVWMKNNLSGTVNVGLRVEGTGLNCAVTPTWQRFQLPWTAASTLSCQILLYDSIAGNDETADISIWGAQCETGSYATSYIPTTTSQVTRAVDNLSLDGSRFAVPSSGGMLVVDWTPFLGASVGGVGVNSASAPGNDRVDIHNTPTYSIISSGGVLQANLNPGSDYRGSRHKAALRWRENSARLAINGALVASEDTALTLPVSLGKLWFGLDGNPSTYNPQAHIRSLVLASGTGFTDADIMVVSAL